MKERMKINILLVLLFLVEIFAVSQFRNCINFSDHFHFSSFDLQLRLIDGIHSDIGVPLWQTRLFHNKVIGFGLDAFAQYLQFWNIQFLASFVSIAGVVGLGAGFYRFFSKKKNWISWTLVSVVALAPFLEIFGFARLPYLARLVFLAIPFLAWSMYGYWYLLKETKISSKIIDGLLIVSLWYLLALPTFGAFCT